MSEELHTPEEMPKRRQRKLIAIGGAAAFAAFVLFSSGHHDADGSTHHGVDEGIAWANCKSAVQEHLRHPSSADFKLTSTDISPAGTGWSILGTVKAENDYGVEDELAYSCTVRPDGTTTAHVRP